MKVVCKCPTFGRLNLLNESVESFLRQDYKGPKELVVYNDCPWMELEFGHPEVTVVNLPFRFPSLGDKLNSLHNISAGDVLINWPNDDIFLPWSISTTLAKLPRRKCFAGSGYWYSEYNEIRKFVRAHCAGMLGYFKRLPIPKYTPMIAGEDQDFVNKLVERALFEVTTLKKKDAFFIYRWGTGSYHLSGYGDDVDAWRFVEQWTRRDYPPGRYRIEPGWQRDYVADIKKSLAQDC